MIPTLVIACANLTSKDNDGLTAIHWAAYEGESTCLSVLLDVGTEINISDFQGWSPLMHAVRRIFVVSDKILNLRILIFGK